MSSTGWRRLLTENGIYASPSARPNQLYELAIVFGLIEEKPSLNQKTGILGWDIAYEPAEWLTTLLGDDWDPRLNPILLPNGTWINHSDVVSSPEINRAVCLLRTCHKGGRRVWASVYPRLIEVDNQASVEPFRPLITQPQYQAAMVGWQGHMRFLYSAGNGHLTFFDPWMSDVDLQPFFQKMEQRLLKQYDCSSEFVQRHPDQSDENSCVIDSLARCIMVAEFGEEAAFWEWGPDTFDYIVFAARIIHSVVS